MHCITLILFLTKSDKTELTGFPLFLFLVHQFNLIRLDFFTQNKSLNRVKFRQLQYLYPTNQLFPLEYTLLNLKGVFPPPLHHISYKKDI